jgi:membrane protein
MPGAVFLGIGTQLLHLATVYYFGVKLSNASELYGPLGVAATLLLWAYIISRLVLTSASINVAAVRSYHHPD